MFEKEIILENTIVKLRPLNKNDVKDFSQIAFDPKIWEYFTYRISTQSDLIDYIDEALLQQSSGMRYTFVIENNNINKITGSTAFGNYSEKDKRVEIGWSWLGTEFQGTGINKNTKYLLLQYAFEHLGLERVEFKTDVLNQKARNALRKIGATEEGTLRSHTLMPGNRRRDTIYYSILKEEWPNVKSKVFSDCSVE